MSPRDLFGLFVRVAGLVCVVFSVFDAYYVVAKLAGWEIASRQTLGTDVAGLAIYGGFGWIGLRLADRLVAFTYGRTNNE